MTLIPDVFIKEKSVSTIQQDTKAIVILSSPFATVKDSLSLFLSNISHTKVCLYFTADCEIIMQNNLSNVEFGMNLNKLITPLSYITESLSNCKQSIEAYSLAVNAIPLMAGLNSGFY